MKEVFFEGMLLQASLIFAIGPQNLFVLESGLKRHYHLTVSLVCFLCDLTLIMLGVVGAGTFFNHFPQIKIVVGIIGIGFLIIYGIGKLKHEDANHLEFERNGKRSCFKAAILSSITFSVVNPHAYLDGIILIGGYSSKYAELPLRVSLGLGAACFSLLWFLGLSMGAATMIPLFANEKRMRFIMSTAGVILLIMSAKLGIDVLGWVQELYPETVASFAGPWRK